MEHDAEDDGKDDDLVELPLTLKENDNSCPPPSTNHQPSPARSVRTRRDSSKMIPKRDTTTTLDASLTALLQAQPLPKG